MQLYLQLRDALEMEKIIMRNDLLKSIVAAGSGRQARKGMPNPVRFYSWPTWKHKIQCQDESAYPVQMTILGPTNLAMLYPRQLRIFPTDFQCLFVGMGT